MITNTVTDTINNVIGKLFDFLINDPEINNDYKAYVDSLMDHHMTTAEIHAVAMAYALERKLDNNKFVYEVFAERYTELNEEEKIIAANLGNAINSSFEIKKLTKTGFQLFSLINEKTYEVTSLRKMFQFRGIVPGQFLVGRILEHNNEYFLIDINTILPSTTSKELYKNVLMLQLDKPESIYQDNDEKLKEIETIVENLGLKFIEFFKSNEIITTSEYADDLIGTFNDYFETNDAEIKSYPQNLVKTPEKYAYFNIEETSSALNPIEKAAKGFSEYKQIYDVGIVFDNDTGLLVLPFYGTFKQICSVEDYKSIEGYEECILNYFKNDKVPPSIISSVYTNNKENFAKIAKEVLKEEEFTDIKSLIHKYKSSYLKQKKYSTLTILYSSKAFNYVMENMNEAVDNPYGFKTGRNEPCICGSGKKYKKCCLK